MAYCEWKESDDGYCHRVTDLEEENDLLRWLLAETIERMRQPLSDISGRMFQFWRGEALRELDGHVSAVRKKKVGEDNYVNR